MHIEKLELSNFRCYSQLDINFHPRLTVLVAANGEGKTSILDAIRIGLWMFVSQFDLARSGGNDSANSLALDDVRLEKESPGLELAGGMLRKLPCQVRLHCVLDGQRMAWTRERKREAAGTKTLEGAGCKEVKFLAEQLQKNIRDTNRPRISLPLFGYYGTGRLWSHKRVTKSKRSGNAASKNIRTIAYQDCLDPASSFRQFEDWFSRVYKTAREQQIKSLEENQPIELQQTSTFQLIVAVQKAVNTVLEPLGWKNLEYSEKYDKSLIMHHPQQGTLKVAQLSDGIKNMLGMIADIAYRCVMLNGHLGATAAEQTSGIIMIDEVDMHLHPQWQQTVLASLMKAFPAMQFVVTTHSPQVLTTVASESIRIFKNGQVHGAPKGSQGAESSRLLKRIFEVDTRPQHDPNTQKLHRYAELVYADQWNSQDAQLLRQQLDQIYGNEEPLLIALDLHRENREWELSLEDDSQNS